MSSVPPPTTYKLFHSPLLPTSFTHSPFTFQSPPPSPSPLPTTTATTSTPPPPSIINNVSLPPKKRSESTLPYQTTPEPIIKKRYNQRAIQRRKDAIIQTLNYTGAHNQIEKVIFEYDGDCIAGIKCNCCQEYIVFHKTCEECKKNYCISHAYQHGRHCYFCNVFRDNYCKFQWRQEFSVCPRCVKKGKKRNIANFTITFNGSTPESPSSSDSDKDQVNFDVNANNNNK